ncbi:MAG: polymorphic toxin type 33 domain-containing protein [Bacteroidota bacterium]
MRVLKIFLLLSFWMDSVSDCKLVVTAESQGGGNFWNHYSSSFTSSALSTATAGLSNAFGLNTAVGGYGAGVASSGDWNPVKWSGNDWTWAAGGFVGGGTLGGALFSPTGIEHTLTTSGGATMNWGSPTGIGWSPFAQHIGRGISDLFHWGSRLDLGPINELSPRLVGTIVDQEHFDFLQEEFNREMHKEFELTEDLLIERIHSAQTAAGNVIINVATTIAPVPKVGLLRYVKNFYKANKAIVVARGSTQTFKSLGAAGRSWKNVKKIPDDLLKNSGLDAHAIKREFLGRSAKISRYDLYKHTDTGEILIFRKGGQGEPIFTGYFTN